MFKLQCSHCGMEMLIPKNQKMILECPKCGGYLKIVENLSEEKHDGLCYGSPEWWETRYVSGTGYADGTSDYDISDFGFGNITIACDGKNSTSENYWVYA